MPARTAATLTLKIRPGLRLLGTYLLALLFLSAASSLGQTLQQRISGVLPVRVDVPRAGNSYNFVRPLVLDEETKVTFTYKSK